MTNRGNPQNLRKTPPLTEHGRGMYRKGCHCEICNEDERRYRAEHYRKLHGITDPDRIGPQTRKLKEQKTEWMNQAACQDRDDLAWIPDADDSEDKIHAKKLAKTFCLDCPVRGECLQYGITTKSMGIWGGSYLFWEPRKKVVNLLGLDG
jgi:hypothetical protein